MAMLDVFVNWWRGSRALAETPGQQYAAPSSQLVADTRLVGPDGAMQIAAVWLCVGRRANIVAALPFFAYTRDNEGHKELARTSRLYALLHDSPNGRMTAFEFWRALMMNYDLRGNAYARIDRDPTTGEAIALWPMPADQVTHSVLPDGTMVYAYRVGTDLAIIASENVLHLKDLGNGTTGLPKLEYMRATTDEAAKAQATASKLFGFNGKPSGVLMVDSVLKPHQREALRANFGEMELAPVGRLFVLEANMKYQQLALSPEDQQLLESRQFGIEEICRWFDVPPVLAYHSNVTTWGSGVEQIIDGWHKMTLGPLLKNIESAVTKRVLTAKQRASMVVEFNLDALLRGNAKDRAEIYAKQVQNGLMSRNEVRQLENLPRIDGADELTAQTNLAPLAMLGKEPPKPAPPADPVLQSEIARFERERIEAKAQADTDRRHDEILSVLRSLQSRPHSISVSNNMPELPAPVVHVTNKTEPGLPPVVNVTNNVSPTPVEVNVTNDVAPTPVEVNASFEATVEPAEVRLSLPDRKTETTVTRDRDGNIVRATQIEKDA